MPIVGARSADVGLSPDDELAKQRLLAKLMGVSRARAQEESSSLAYDNPFPSDDDEDDVWAIERSAEEERTRIAAEHKEMVEKTKNIPLEKVVFSIEGCQVFDELCLLIDVNQRYASVLPQWKDVADHLEVDKLRTKWVETCVRPREGLTRAMLEIYMKDGGTLGDVLEALLKLECFDILQTVRPKVEQYLLNRRDGEESETSSKFYSIIRTLMTVFGNADPCSDLHKYSNGLKFTKRYGNFLEEDKEYFGEGSKVHLGTVKDSGLGVTSREPAFRSECLSRSGSLFRSELHLEELKDHDKHLKEDLISKIGGSKKLRCRILLLFSADGADASDVAVAMAGTIDHDEVIADLFRLNEISLWYEALTNPEGCCLKWCQEADYIMPVLTPMFLQEIYGNAEESDSGLLPTSPILNRYMYTLARTQYTRSGCKNLKVRPIIPLNCLRRIRTSNAVVIDPLLNSSWVPLNEERFTRRITGMLNEHLRRKREEY